MASGKRTCYRQRQRRRQQRRRRVNKERGCSVVNKLYGRAQAVGEREYDNDAVTSSERPGDGTIHSNRAKGSVPRRATAGLLVPERLTSLWRIARLSRPPRGMSSTRHCIGLGRQRLLEDPSPSPVSFWKAGAAVARATLRRGCTKRQHNQTL